MSIDVEEMIRAQPMDAVVLVGGCDKTVPAQLMGAASADVPAMQLARRADDADLATSGERLGACTDCRRFWAKHRAGKVDAAEIEEIEGNLATTAGTCAVMGTASRWRAIAEALGMALPGTAAIPAVHADRLRAAEAAGRRAVQLARVADPAERRSSPRSRSRTRCACCSRSAARPTRSCTSPRSPGRAGIHISTEATERALGRDAGAGRPEADRPALHVGPVRGRRRRRGAARAASRCCTSTA